MNLYAKNTKVPIAQSRMEIERLLDRHKAKAFGTAIDNDRREARVQFRLHDRVVRFVINLPDPTKIRGAERFATAERQRWRALLLVIKAKLEAVENAISTFEEEFLAHIVLPNDRTVADYVIPQVAAMYQTGHMLALPEATDRSGGTTE